jgi:hypothetical protein
MTSRTLLLFSVVFLGSITVLSQQALSQQAIVRRNTTLRSEPSAAAMPEGQLQVNDRLTLVDPTAEHGYLQVQTSSGIEGWVFSRHIRVLASPSSSEPSTDPETSNPPGTQCDDTLWQHVYHPHRLIVKQPCIAVTGTIVDATNGREHDGVRHETDGDTHGWLKVDPEFEGLLNAGNLNNEGGNLVFEIVCKFVPPTQADAEPACENYQSPIVIPPVGTHVRIVGTYVRDTNHAQWMEIHPVSSITVLH